MIPGTPIVDQCPCSGQQRIISGVEIHQIVSCQRNVLGQKADPILRAFDVDGPSRRAGVPLVGNNGELAWGLSVLLSHLRDALPSFRNLTLRFSLLLPQQSSDYRLLCFLCPEGPETLFRLRE